MDDLLADIFPGQEGAGGIEGVGVGDGDEQGRGQGVDAGDGGTGDCGAGSGKTPGLALVFEAFEDVGEGPVVGMVLDARDEGELRGSRAGEGYVQVEETGGVLGIPEGAGDAKAAEWVEAGEILHVPAVTGPGDPQSIIEVRGLKDRLMTKASGRRNGAEESVFAGDLPAVPILRMGYGERRIHC